MISGSRLLIFVLIGRNNIFVLIVVLYRFNIYMVLFLCYVFDEVFFDEVIVFVWVVFMKNF